ncbi:MAG: LysR family transcriptional regulator [Candidatus Competibacter sp.]|nr:LysR family transcriptional regulator [Candidatus Competibacter sp.]
MKSRGVDLAQMAAFVAVAETGSFTAAAERSGVTKSALSQTITLLERELGAQLLQRSTRKLALTETGTAFLDDCHRLLAQAEQVIERARTRQAALSGTLRITSTLDYTLPVARWIAEYRNRYPAMRIDYLPTDQPLDLIEGRFDLALRLGRLQDSSLRAVKLMDLDLLLVASPAYLARSGALRTLKDLRSQEWLAFNILPRPWTLPLWREGKTLAVRMRGSIGVSAAIALKELALAGAGMAALPEPLVRGELNLGRLVRLLPAYRLPPLQFYALYPGALAPPAKTRAFIDLAKEEIRDDSQA